MHKQLASVLVSSTRELKRSGSAPPNVLEGLDLDIPGSPGCAGGRGRDLGSSSVEQGIDLSSRAYVEFFYANRLCNPR
jgi:hypothetical protein